MAYLASSCFVGDAFYWFEQLDSNVQDDWSRLRPAMVAKFGRDSIVSPAIGLRGSAAASPSPTIPTPAAAPPAQRLVRTGRTGRLRVLDLGGDFLGYLSARTLYDGTYTGLTTDRNSAITVFIPPAGGPSPFEIKILTSLGGSDSNDLLAMMWNGLTSPQWTLKKDYRASCCSLLRAQLECWAVESKVWSIIGESELRPQYPLPTGGIQGLEPDLFSVFGDKSISWIKSEADNPNRTHLRVLFEGAYL